MQKEKLRTVRKRKGYTQQQVADAIATDVSNYNRKECGAVKIIHSEWERIAKFLNVPVNEIYEEDEVKINIDHPVFNDNAQGNLGNINATINNELSIEIIKNLQDYISLLKEEINKLKNK